jgi:hypothetical protein
MPRSFTASNCWGPMRSAFSKTVTAGAVTGRDSRDSGPRASETPRRARTCLSRLSTPLLAILPATTLGSGTRRSRISMTPGHSRRRSRQADAGLCALAIARLVTRPRALGASLIAGRLHGEGASFAQPRPETTGRSASREWRSTPASGRHRTRHEQSEPLARAAVRSAGHAQRWAALGKK